MSTVNRPIIKTSAISSSDAKKVPLEPIFEKAIKVLNSDKAAIVAAKLLCHTLKIGEDDSMKLMEIHNKWSAGTQFMKHDGEDLCSSKAIADIASAALYCYQHCLDIGYTTSNPTAEGMLNSEARYYAQTRLTEDDAKSIKTPTIPSFSFKLRDWMSWKEKTYNLISALGLVKHIDDSDWHKSHKKMDKALMARFKEAFAESDFRLDPEACGSTVWSIWKYLKGMYEAYPVLVTEAKMTLKEFEQLSWKDMYPDGLVTNMYDFYIEYMKVINHLKYLNKLMEDNDEGPYSDATNIVKQAKTKFLDLCNKDSKLSTLVT